MLNMLSLSLSLFPASSGLASATQKATKGPFVAACAQNLPFLSVPALHHGKSGDTYLCWTDCLFAGIGSKARPGRAGSVPSPDGGPASNIGLISDLLRLLLKKVAEITYAALD
ncbi:hypothetical protein LY76DRAFT_587069 [Colletotrichum caudatum]|nr:hypothetical protein LY76DRAFT_587069 [Colletotrichum caudatum]